MTLAAFEYRVPLARFAQGKKFVQLGAITLATTTPLGTATTTHFFRVEATPVRPMVDDVASDYVPELGEYPNVLHAKVDPPVFDSLPVEASIRVVLTDTTAYPGCAMNADNGAAPCPLTAANDDQDVKFAATVPPGCTAGLVYGMGPDWELDCSSAFKTDVPFKLEVEDFAAYTKIHAEATAVKVGTQVFWLGIPTQGRVRGRPESERFATLPVDRGEAPNSIAGNRIADVGWKALVNSSTGATVSVADTFAADKDLDSIPVGDGWKGDGLVALEEYRGFSARGVHRRLNPEQKDLFIVNDDPVIGGYGIGFAANLPAVVHLIRGSEVSSLDVVNHLATGIANHVSQYRVEVHANAVCDNPLVVLFGLTITSLAGGVATDCDVYVNRIRRASPPTSGATSCGISEPADDDVIRWAIGHEVGHAVNMLGDYQPGARGPDDSIMVAHGPVKRSNLDVSLFTYAPGFYDATDVSQLRLRP